MCVFCSNLCPHSVFYVFTYAVITFPCFSLRFNKPLKISPSDFLLIHLHSVVPLSAQLFLIPWHTCRAMAYLLQGPSTTGNKTTTHRTHRYSLFKIRSLYSLAIFFAFDKLLITNLNILSWWPERKEKRYEQRQCCITYLVYMPGNRIGMVASH
jgi:hypothetical protein